MPQHYFAYGSNMSSSELHAHCPTARSQGRARLDGWRLAFTVSSAKRQGGVADIVRSPADSVWGVLWEIEDDELPALDRKEGYAPERQRADNLYERVDLQVLLDGDPARACPAFAYEVIAKQASHVPPHAAYGAILRRGALEHGLPREYWDAAEALLSDEPAGV
jgi:hypothetical protein